MPTRLLRDWTDSHRINALSCEAERFFTRLLMKADDYGRFHGDSHTLKSLLFPTRPEIRPTDIDHWIAECMKVVLILRYQVRGHSFLGIIDFGQSVRATKSKFPPPSGELPENVKANANGCLLYAYSNAYSNAEAEAMPPPEAVKAKAEKTKAILEKQR